MAHVKRWVAKCYFQHRSPSSLVASQATLKPLDMQAISGQKPGTAAERFIMSASAVGVSQAKEGWGREGSPTHQQPTAVTQKHKFGKYHNNQTGDWVTERGIICVLSLSQAKALTLSENCPSLSSLLFHSDTIKTAPFHAIYLYGPSMSRPNVEDNSIKVRAAI